jgi:hypothetical protein
MEGRRWRGWIGPAARQVDYRLNQDAGCGLSHGPDGGPVRGPDGGTEDAQVD